MTGEPDDPPQLHVVSWNIWLEDVHLATRMEGVLRCLRKLRPTVVCLQEVTPRGLELLLADPQLAALYDSSAAFFDPCCGYGVLTLAVRRLQAQFSAHPLPSEMGRQLVAARWQAEELHGGEVVVGNVHLESMDSQPVREEQLRLCHHLLLQPPGARATTTLLAGDFNFCSLRNFKLPAHKGAEAVPLDNDCLKRCLPGFQDSWLLLADSPSQQPPSPCSPSARCFSSPNSAFSPPSPRTPSPRVLSVALTTPSKSSEEEGEGEGEGGEEAWTGPEGFSYDSRLNGLLGHKEERMRYDRIMLRPPDPDPPESDLGHSRPVWRARRMRLLGTRALEPGLLLTTRSSGLRAVRGLWASDHFGLSLRLSLAPAPPRPPPCSEAVI